jgi:hypothetical protein
MFNGMSEEQYEVLSEEFFVLADRRANQGASEYGNWGFLTNNTFRMIHEELADIVNYALFTYIKVRLLESRLEDELRSRGTSLHAESDPNG